MKRRLLEEYERLLDKMLADKAADEEILLSEIEAAAIKVGEASKQQIVQHLSEEAKRGQVDCPGCGKVLNLKDYRSRQVVTEAGEIRLRRAYYYCRECQQGIFPPG